MKVLSISRNATNVTTETWNEEMLLKKWCWLAGYRGATNIQFVKRKTESVKCNKAKNNKTRSANIREHFLRGIFKDKRWEFDPWLGRSLRKDMEIRSSILAWRILWTEEPGGLQSVGSWRVTGSCLWPERLSMQVHTRVTVPFTPQIDLYYWMLCHLLNSTFLGEKNIYRIYKGN